MPSDALAFGVTAALGILVTAAELVALHRAAPFRALLTAPGIGYMALNAVTSVLALLLLRALGWAPSSPSTPSSQVWVSVLVAGIAAPVVLRTSFTFHAGTQELTLSLGQMLQRILDAVKRAVDRKQAQIMAATVNKLMNNVDFEKAEIILPTYCFSLMQGVTPEEQAEAGRTIRGIHNSTTMTNQQKSFYLGIQLIRIAGEDLLRAAVTNNRESISL